MNNAFRNARNDFLPVTTEELPKEEKKIHPAFSKAKSDFQLEIGKPPLKTHEQIDASQKPPPDYGNPDLKKPEEEEDSTIKSIGRTLFSPLLGAASAKTYAIDLLSMFGVAEGLSGLEEYSDLISGRYGIDTNSEAMKAILEGQKRDEQRSGKIFESLKPEYQEELKKIYAQNVAQAGGSFPTVTNIAEYLEKKTGLPLTPKTWLQKSLNLGSLVATFTKSLPKEVGKRGVKELARRYAPKASAGITAPAVSGIAQVFGANEQGSDILGMSLAGLPYATTQLIKKGFPSAQHAALQTKLVGENLPESSFGQAESALVKLQEPERINLQREGLQRQAEVEAKTEQLLLKEQAQQRVRLQHQAEKYAEMEEAAAKQNSLLEKQQVAAANQRTAQEQKRILQEAKELEKQGKTLSKEQQQKFKIAQEKALEASVTNQFTRTPARNEAIMGYEALEGFQMNSELVHAGVGDLYAEAEFLQQGIETIHPEYYAAVEDISRPFRELGFRSAVENKLLSACEGVMNMCARRTMVEGIEHIEYLPIRNQILINQIRSFNQIADHEFTHAGARRQFNPLIAATHRAAEEAAVQALEPAAVEAIQEARLSHGLWARTFDNETVQHFRSAQNTDYVKMGKELNNPDVFNQVYEGLTFTPATQEVANRGLAQLVKTKLDPFMKDPKGMNINKFEEVLRELESVSGVEHSHISNIRDAFMTARETDVVLIKSKGIESKQLSTPRKPVEKIKPSEISSQGQHSKIPYRKPLAERGEYSKITQTQKNVSKYLDKKPEHIQRLLESRSGIKELREGLKGSETGKKNFDLLTRHKMRDLIRSNKNDIYKTLQKQENFDIFAEILGEEATKEARELSKKISGTKELGKLLVKYGASAGAIRFFNVVKPLVFEEDEQ